MLGESVSALERVLVLFVCKVHANINYFLFSNEMKYDIKPNHQLITLNYQGILLELLEFFEATGSNIKTAARMKEGKNEF